MAVKVAGSGSPSNPAGRRRGDVPAEIERDRWGRPLIPQPDGRLLPYTRASSLGGVLEDQYGLGRWRMRQAVWGLSRRSDLHLAVQAIRTTDQGGDRDRLDKLAEQALEAAESSAKATVGTALHALSERVDAGEEIPHVTGEARAALDAYVELTREFAILATETFVVCDDHQVAGTFDRLVAPMVTMQTPCGGQIAAGEPLIGDLKTSGTADYFGIKFAVQLAEYAHGVPFTIDAGRLDWSVFTGSHPLPHPRWGLIVHVPSGNPDAAGLYWVDLAAGRELSDLAIRVRDERKRKDLVMRAEVPTASVDHVVELIRRAPSKAVAREIWKMYRDIWTPEFTEMVEQLPA
jgi:hypothetical protein